MRVRMSSLAIAFACLLVIAPGSQAQDRPFPYELNRNDIVLFAVGGGLEALSWSLDKIPPPPTQELASYDRRDVNAFDRPATYWFSKDWATASEWASKGLFAATGIGSFASTVPSGRFREAAVLGVMFAEAYFVLDGYTYAMKRLTDRPRPYVFNTELTLSQRKGREGWEHRWRESFSSGFAAAAFGSATLLSTFVTDIYGPSATTRAVWVSSLSVAAFISWARVAAGLHYPTDILVGAAVGAGVGRLIPRLHRKGSGRDIRVVPTPGGFVVSIPLGGGQERR